MPNGSELVNEFLTREIHLTPNALEYLLEREDSLSAAKEVLTDLKEMPEKPPVVTREMISDILGAKQFTVPERRESSELIEGPESSDVSKQETPALLEHTIPEGPSHETAEDRVEAPSGKSESRVKVLRDVTGQSTSEGTIEDFVQLFRDRYDKLSKIIQRREDFRDPISIENLNRFEGRDVKIVGLVDDRRETRKGDAYLLRLEDTTGSATVYVRKSKENRPLLDKIRRIVTDEVVGVGVRVPDPFKGDGRSPLVWGNNVVFPEVPVPSAESGEFIEGRKAKRPACAVLMSDLHIGSKMFLRNAFERFLGWLREEEGTGEQQKLAGNVEYLIIAGDLVDGIGIYPKQQDELEITNVYEQYEAVAEFLSQVPKRIQIIVSPGNHDAVRAGEPQPALSSEVACVFDGLNVELVGNPSSISLDGTDLLIYHGRSFDDFISACSELDYEDPIKPMERVLQKRHLAPIYGDPMGGRSPIVPEEMDYLVIEEAPDVLHCGHLHRYGCEIYRGVLMVNSGTFQGRTSYMRMKGVVPTPGIVPVLDLQTMDVRAIHFD